MITDFHSHVLPCLDDGSASVEQSIEMLQAEAEQGITHVVATPHFYPSSHKLDSFISKVDNAISQLKENPLAYKDLDICVMGVVGTGYRWRRLDFYGHCQRKDWLCASCRRTRKPELEVRYPDYFGRRSDVGYIFV